MFGKKKDEIDYKKLAKEISFFEKDAIVKAVAEQVARKIDVNTYSDMTGFTYSHKSFREMVMDIVIPMFSKDLYDLKKAKLLKSYSGKKMNDMMDESIKSEMAAKIESIYNGTGNGNIVFTGRHY